MSPRFPALITTDALFERLGDPDLKIVDATWYLPPHPTNAQDDYRKQHLPGAVFFDIDAIADPHSPLPHMLPSAEQFAAQVGALGIANTHTVVVYDQHGLM